MALILPNDLANGQDADGDKLQQNFIAIETWGNTEAVVRDGSVAMTGPLLLPGAPTQPNQAATKEYADSSGAFVGEMKMFAGDAAPNANWLLCQGQAIGRSQYAVLFSVVGIRFGAGDGSTTFNLPDMRGQYPIGHNAGGAYGQVGVGQRFGGKDAVLPVHNHDGTTSTEDASHFHNFNANTGPESNDHQHYMESTADTSSGPGLGDRNIWPSGAGVGGGILTAGATVTHFHGVAGPTSGPSALHRHPFTTGNRGVDGTNGNLPPSVSVNFIMKVA